MSIELLDNSIRVNDWHSESEDVVNYFKQVLPESREETFNRTVKIGVLALRDTNLHVKVDYVEKTFNVLKDKLEKDFDSRVKNIIDKLDEIFKDESGKLPKVMKEYLGDGGSLYKLLIDPTSNKSTVSQMESLMKKHLIGRDSSMYKILDHNDDQSPLKTLRQQIETAISWAKDKVVGTEAAQEAYAAGTQHGRDYEDLVYDGKLEPLAKLFGDTAQNTKNTPGSLGPKTIVGDAVVILNPKYSSGVNAKIVFEMKDKPLSMPAMLAELESAKKNRDAASAVMVFKKLDDMPAQGKMFGEFSGNCFSCWYDPASPEQYTLEFTYRIAKFNVIKDNLLTHDKKIDLKNLVNLFVQLKTDLKAFAAIKTKITQTKGALDTINDDIEVFEERLKDSLKKIDTALMS